MKDQTPLNKAVPSMIWHSRDYRFNSLLALIFSGVFYLGVYHFSQIPGRLGRDPLLLLIWALMLGIGLLLGSSMVVDVTVKDKLSHRLDFFLASGIDIKSLILAYSLQMCRFSMVIPFALLMAFVFLPVFEMGFISIVGLFGSTAILVFVTLLYFNVLVLEQKHLKFVKYLLFITVNLLIYGVGSVSNQFLQFLANHHIALSSLVLLVNVSLTLVLAGLASLKWRHLTNEWVIRQEGTWS
ncbi:hypothetical protein [Facklamia hominis]|uniref:hypothetical protein n=1 Tax=Facklamia hominis TaxID=178214 RepID=UPI0038FC6FFA